MVDLYNIPGDNKKDFRLNKFVEYQHNAISVAPPILRLFSIENKLNEDDCIYLCWLHSLTYCEITAIILFMEIPLKSMKDFDFEKYWLDKKNKLQFCSSRMYVKNMNWFVSLMRTFLNKTNCDLLNWINSLISGLNPFDAYEKIYSELTSWKYVGRFATERFLEILSSMSEHNLISIKIKSREVDWKIGSNLTSGIFNIFYEDEKANKFDSDNFLDEKDFNFLENKSKEIYNKVLEIYPNQENQDFIIVMSKICSFRNLFKKARYGGFHYDRELEIIHRYENCGYNMKNIYSFRKKSFPNHMLGELHDWEGIRPERKKYWLKYGLTCAEENCDEIIKNKEINFGLFEE